MSGMDEGAETTELRRGVLGPCVLALLAERPRFGLELVRDLSRADGLLTSEGTVYPLLSRLRRDGMVDTTWQESKSGPPRRYYRLTRSGEAAVRSFSDQWQLFRNAVDRVLAEEV